jgi:hypothetical protein
VLCAATANALVLPGERRKRIDRAGKVPGFKRRETAGQGGKIRAGRITLLSDQLLHLPGTVIERRVISHHGLGQDDVHIKLWRARQEARPS